MIRSRDGLLAWLKVPPAPAAPAGDEHVRVFRAAPNYFRYRVFVWALRQLGGLIALVAYLVFVSPRFPFAGEQALRGGSAVISSDTIETIFWLAEMAGILAFLTEVVVSGALLRLDFEQRWYLVSDRSVRIREGLVRLQEKTMTFANVQHVAIRQNPIQQLLGIADVEVRSAGGGAGGGKERHTERSDRHIAYLRGVDCATEIRDTIRERLRRHADAGLGDPDQHPAVPAAPAATFPDVARLARALRDESRALRIAVEQWQR